MLYTIHDLKRLHLRAVDGDIGHVQEFYFDDETWAVRYLVADTGGWLTGRRVLISPHDLMPIYEVELALPVEITKAQITDSPLSDSDMPVSLMLEADYRTFYGWPGDWGTGFEPGMRPNVRIGTMMPLTAIDDSAAVPHAHGDPHLRSTNDVTGYKLSATDGEIGHVTDFLIDDVTWKVSFLIADTNFWWPGKKVLIAPEWITQIDWDTSQVVVDVTRSQVSSAPVYTSKKSADNDYEAALHHTTSCRVFEGESRTCDPSESLHDA